MKLINQTNKRKRWETKIVRPVLHHCLIGAAEVQLDQFQTFWTVVLLADPVSEEMPRYQV